MRVVHVASGREWRGGQRQVLFLARALHERPGIDVQVVTGRGTLLADRLADAGVAVAAVPWSTSLDPRVLLRLAGLIDRNTIVHAHDSHAHLLADLATKWRDAPVVVTRRDIQPLRHPARYRRAAAIIAISDSVASVVRDAGVDDRRLHVVPDATGMVGRVREEPHASPPTIVCIAALQQVKGVDVLLHAAALLRAEHPDTRWIVLGEGPERARLEALRDALQLRDVVSLPGFVALPENDLAQATLVVQPSRREALGSSVLDALALGIPVVASRVDGLPEALSRGGGVLVAPDAPAELAETVGRLLADAGERRRLGDAGRVAATHFSIPRMVERTVDVYRSLRIETES